MRSGSPESGPGRSRREQCPTDTRGRDEQLASRQALGAELAAPPGRSPARGAAHPRILGKADATTAEKGAAGEPQSDHRPTLDAVTVAPVSGTPREPPVAEPCLRCGAAMEWRHQTLECPRCRFKIGCCEGTTGECTPR